jgi:hypothetical protein
VQAPGGEAAHVDVQRGVPPVVARGGSRQPDLAEDLAVQVQVSFVARQSSRCNPGRVILA